MQVLKTMVILSFSFKNQINYYIKISWREKSLFLPCNKYRKILAKILLVIEDKYFYEHNNINIFPTGEALLINIISGYTI